MKELVFTRRVLNIVGKNAWISWWCGHGISSHQESASGNVLNNFCCTFWREWLPWTYSLFSYLSSEHKYAQDWLWPWRRRNTLRDHGMRKWKKPGSLNDLMEQVAYQPRWPDNHTGKKESLCFPDLCYTSLVILLSNTGIPMFCFFLDWSRMGRRQSWG